MNRECTSFKKLCILMITGIILASFSAVMPFSIKNEILVKKTCADPESDTLQQQESQEERIRDELGCTTAPDKQLLTLFILGIINIDEMTMWVIGVDRRVVVLKMMHERKMIQASDIADSTDRSLQNISYAMRELEEHGLIRSLTPGKKTWKKFILTEKGSEIYENLKKNNLIGE